MIVIYHHQADNIKYAPQMADEQQCRDDQLFDLLETMSRTLTLACKTEEIGFLKSCHDIIREVVTKAQECSSFLRKTQASVSSFIPFHKYASLIFPTPVLRAVKYAIPQNVDQDIACFRNDFQILHRNLDTRILLSAAQQVDQNPSHIGHGVHDISTNGMCIRFYCGIYFDGGHFNSFPERSTFCRSELESQSWML
jgi:hypothetical protein